MFARWSSSTCHTFYPTLEGRYHDAGYLSSATFPIGVKRIGKEIGRAEYYELKARTMYFDGASYMDGIFNWFL